MFYNSILVLPAAVGLYMVCSLSPLQYYELLLPEMSSFSIPLVLLPLMSENHCCSCPTKTLLSTTTKLAKLS